MGRTKDSLDAHLGFKFKKDVTQIENFMINNTLEFCYNFSEYPTFANLSSIQTNLNSIKIDSMF